MMLIWLPRLPLSDPGAKRTDNCQESVAGDGRERHYTGNHTQNCIRKNGNYASFYNRTLSTANASLIKFKSIKLHSQSQPTLSWEEKWKTHFKSRLCKNQTSYSLTCVKDPYLAENRWKNIFMTELPDQALNWAPDRDHQVGDGQVHQVVVHCCPVKWYQRSSFKLKGFF